MADTVQVWVVRCPSAGDPMIFTDPYSAADERDELIAQGYDDAALEADASMTLEELDTLPEHPGWG